jgi:hypothetical protein
MGIGWTLYFMVRNAVFCAMHPFFSSFSGDRICSDEVLRILDEADFPTCHCEHLEGAWQSHWKKRDCFARKDGILNRDLGLPFFLTITDHSIKNKICTKSMR